MSHREKILGRKLKEAEERLKFLEQFVERFCNSFRDYLARPISEGNREGDKGTTPSSTTPRMSTLSSTRSGPRQARNKIITEEGESGGGGGRRPMQECFVRLTNCLEDTDTDTSSDTTGSTGPSFSCPHSSGSSSGSGSNSEDESVEMDKELGDGGGDEEEEDAYFTYPGSVSGGKNEQAIKTEVEDSIDDGDNDALDGDAGNGLDDEDDDDYLPPTQIELPDIGKCKIDSAKTKKNRKPVAVSKRVNSTLHKLPTPKRRKYPTLRMDMSTFKTLTNVNLLTKDPSKRECSLCHAFFSKETFQAHLESHTKARHLQCSFCDKSYYSLNTLQLHEKSHQLDKYGKACRICGKMCNPQPYKTLEHERVCLRRAMERNETVDPAVVENIKSRSVGVDLKLPEPGDPAEMDPSIPRKKCPRCWRFFKLDEYPEHFRSHVIVRDWKCKICPKEYASKQILMRHIVMAHGPDSTKCWMCQNSFKDRETLRLHKYQCEKRKKVAFKRKSKPKQKQSTTDDDNADVSEGGDHVEETESQNSNA